MPNLQRYDSTVGQHHIGSAMARICTWVCFASLLIGRIVCAQPATKPDQPTGPDFNREVLPILSEHCFACHGPDKNSREADLRLDQEQGALAAIDRKQPQQSELLARIFSDDADTLMPPPASKHPLSAKQKKTLAAWIKAGAPWGVHWAFSPIKRPQVPSRRESWPGITAIDRFVQRRLVESGLTPAQQAQRHTLLRRLTLDLTGLPPTPEAVKAFLNDSSPMAYRRVVDRLLQSPDFGTAQAWSWLDAARYADSNGYQGDRERSMWPWRDWVIRSINRNLPFDQFTVWQLAGDLLPNATMEQRLATGFCRNHMINGEGGRIPEENRVDYVMDMTETMGTVWLGLTLNCCRCHDHKFDPLTQAEYYQFYSFFNQTPVTGAGGDPRTAPVLAIPSADQQQQLAAWKHQLTKLVSQRQARSQVLRQDSTVWQQELKRKLTAEPQWRVLKPTSATAVHQQLQIQSDASVLATGENPANDTYSLTCEIKHPQQVATIRLEALQHPSLPNGGLSRVASGNFVLTEFVATLERQGKATPLKFSRAKATYEQGSLRVSTAFDGNRRTGWAVYNGKPVNREHQAIFVLANQLDLVVGDRIKFTLAHDSVHVNHNLGRFRLSLSAAREPKFKGANDQLLQILQQPAAKRTAAQQEQLLQYQLSQDAVVRKLQTEIKRLQQQVANVERSLPKVMVMADQSKLRQTTILDRGLYNQPREKVGMGVPQSLPQMRGREPQNRLGLAKWIVSKEQPLTSRVIVNRLWQRFFGIGLVKSTEDFGIQGEFPSHPELLDYLASEFQESGWDIKHMIRLMVLSHTYRQSSHLDEKLREQDPENRLFARAARYRLESWKIRDQALAASGLLVNNFGGPPVNGYQPAGVWEEATFGKKKYQQDRGAALYRRSLYIFWRRIIAPTMFFDNASRQTCTVKQFRTNTPLHALVTLNDTTYVEAARALAETVLNARHDTAARIDAAFLRLLARRATAQEQQILQQGLQRTKQQYRANSKWARQFIEIGESTANKKYEAGELASWTALCLAILNLDETLSRE